IRLLGKDKSEDVLRTAMEDLLAATQASLIGYLRINDEGRFTPRMVVPETEDRSTLLLSNSLTETVYRKRNGVWLSDHLGGGSVSESLQHFADAMCFPLVHDQQFLGAMHVYRAKGRFDQDKFEFAKSVANIVAQALGRAYREELLRSDFQRLKAKTGGFDELIGECPPMLELKSKIQRLSRTTGCVLIRGESGAGKELVARALHRCSARADRPMLTVNCAAIPEDLMESQLFGHRAGAFTGADNDHKGFFQQADGGTLFLDEVGELTLAGQAKLLRILEGHPFLPVGSTEQVRVDVRVIAATNQDLQTYVREKRFREDLYYRLSVFELPVPALRERGQDLRSLIDYFLDLFRAQHGRPNLKLSPAARQKLMTYHWPGNVRQLRNVMDSAVVLAADPAIEPSDLGLRDAGDAPLASLRIDDWERKLIVEALARTGHNIPEAAKLLGLGRATLYRKLTEYGLGRSD
ncbi:MAG TPA: sigma-54-dependent Fis family transcriptional regulator, partial [Pirellulales bacterium]